MQRATIALAVSTLAALALTAAAPQVAPPGKAPMRAPDFLEHPPALHSDAQDDGQNDGEQETPPTLWCLRNDGSIGRVLPGEQPEWNGIRAAAVEHGAKAQIDPTAGVLHLVDGQKIRGRLQECADGVEWQSMWLPPIRLTPANVREFRVGGSGGIGSAAAAPQALVELSSGKRMPGIIESFGSAHLLLRMGDGPPEPVRWDQVRCLHTAEPPRAPLGPRLWLTDGSCVGASAIRWESADEIGVALNGVAGEIRATIPRRALLGYASAVEHMHALDGAVPTVSQPSGFSDDRYSVEPPHALAGEWALGASPIEVQGPVILKYPGIATAGTATMAVELADPSDDASSVDVALCSNGAELRRVRLTAAEPRAELSAALPTGALEVAVVPVNGSWVGCVVLLDRAIIAQR